MIVSLALKFAVKLITLATSLGLSPLFIGWNDIWDALDNLNAPPAFKQARSRMRDLMRRHEAQRMIKALRS